MEDYDGQCANKLISSWLLPIHSAEIYFISGAFAGILEFLRQKNLRYEPAVSLSERSLRRSEFDKPAHAFSRFLQT